MLTRSRRDDAVMTAPKKQPLGPGAESDISKNNVPLSKDEPAAASTSAWDDDMHSANGGAADDEMEKLLDDKQLPMDLPVVVDVSGIQEPR
jgi:hypothetical protein